MKRQAPVWRKSYWSTAGRTLTLSTAVSTLGLQQDTQLTRSEPRRIFADKIYPLKSRTSLGAIF
jgi:hypothetical protein